MSDSFREILQQLGSEPKLSSSKLYSLSRMNQTNLNTFNEVWPTIPVQRRRTIIQELMETAEVNFEVDFDPVFLTALADEDAEVRTVAIKSLWDYEQPSLIHPLIHLLKTDEASTVREAAASGLGKFVYLKELEEIDWNEGNLAEEALLEIIHQSDEDSDVQRRAVEAIAFSSRPGVAEIIEAAYYSDDEKFQVSAVFAMGRSADKRWLPLVIEELDNNNTEIRFEAARSCGELEAKGAVNKLIIIIDEDPDLEVQEMAIWALGRIGGDLARQALEACLDSENEVLAMAAEESLDELNIFADDDLMLYDFEYDDEDDDDYYDDLDDFDSYSNNGNNGADKH
ncbi:MAG: HEAT repeat domain-containing protein [Anaerolineae bacterium]|nr:HEAT repeat domain-containing protein [Anaerolineae bacterium]